MVSPPVAADPVAEPPAADEPALPAPVAATTQPAEPPVAVTRDPAQDGARDAAWLLDQAPDSFTLQLFTLSSEERLERFLEAQADPEQFAIYRLERNGRILHVVVYGLFATRAEADAASRRLPASVGPVEPWVRTLGQVQDAARTSMAQ